MAHLDTLNIVVKPNLRPVSAEDQKRHKLIIKLQEQLSMAEAELSGNSYRRMKWITQTNDCLLYTSPSPRDGLLSRMPSSA